VIFKTKKTDPRKIEPIIEKALKVRFMMPIKIVLRSLEDIEYLMSHIPKSWSQPLQQKRNVIFLRPAIDNPKLAKSLNPKPGIEELHYQPGVLLWSAQTSNLTKSNMLKLSIDPIYKEMTVRGFNTVQKIYALMQKIDALAD
jgi:uncharacterized protein (DUF1697 family)